MDFALTEEQQDIQSLARRILEAEVTEERLRLAEAAVDGDRFDARTWKALATIPDYKDSLPALRNAVDACKKAGDKYAMRKLLTVFNEFAAKLNGLIAPLDGNSDSDRKALEDAKTIREVVGKLEQEVAEFVKANP